MGEICEECFTKDDEIEGLKQDLLKQQCCIKELEAKLEHDPRLINLLRLSDKLVKADARTKELETIAVEMPYAILDGRRLPSELDPIPECGLQALHPAEPERWRKLLFPEEEDDSTPPLSRQPQGKAPGVPDNASVLGSGAELKAYESQASEPAGNPAGEAGDSEEG